LVILNSITVMCVHFAVTKIQTAATQSVIRDVHAVAVTQKLESLGYTSVADIIGPSSFQFSWLAARGSAVVFTCTTTRVPSDACNGRLWRGTSDSSTSHIWRRCSYFRLLVSLRAGPDEEIVQDRPDRFVPQPPGNADVVLCLLSLPLLPVADICPAFYEVKALVMPRIS